MKKIVLVLIIASIIAVMPINSLANASGAYTLPKLEEMPELPKLPDLPEFELPELDELEIPEMSLDYEKMLKDLQKQGLGQYKFDDDDFKLDLSDIDKDVIQKFKKEFGDKWESIGKAMKTNSVLPDNFKDFVKRFGKESKAILESLKEKDNKKFASLMENQLDASKLFYDFDKIKSEFKWDSVSPKVMKPEGWDELAKAAKHVKMPDNWMTDVPKPEGYGEKDILEAAKEFLLDKIPGSGLFGRIKDSLIGGGKWLANYKEAKQKVNVYAKHLEEKIKNGEKLTDEDLKKAKELAEQEINALFGKEKK